VADPDQDLAKRDQLDQLCGAEARISPGGAVERRSFDIMEERAPQADDPVQADEVAFDDAGRHGVKIEAARSADCPSGREKVKLRERAPEAIAHDDRIGLVPGQAPARGRLRQGLEGGAPVVLFLCAAGEVLEYLGRYAQVLTSTSVSALQAKAGGAKKIGAGLELLPAGRRKGL